MYIYVDSGNEAEDSHKLHGSPHKVNGYAIEVCRKDKTVQINLESSELPVSFTRIEMERDEAIRLVSKILSVL